MTTHVMYSQKIKRHNRVFSETVETYRAAVDFFISVSMEEWDIISGQATPKERMNKLESMTHPTSKWC